jgi:L,D-peptidoglycan transpeptidase YkuD (ErfK/YbiS/YcfS/YnhG family)
VVLASLASLALAVACPSNAANDLRPQPSSSQLITVETTSTNTTYGTLRTWRHSAGCWVAADGPYAARVGRNGIRKNRREGDGTTPIGTFRIGRVMYGNEPNPGVKFRYQRLRCGDWWNEDPSSPTYNTLQRLKCGEQPPFAVKSLGMWQERTAYTHLAVVEFNMNPVVPGRGSGIFLHAQTGGPTNGCISLRRPDLVRVLRWLRPSSAPRITIATRE